MPHDADTPCSIQCNLGKCSFLSCKLSHSIPLKVCILLTNNSGKKEHPFSFYSIYLLHKLFWHPPFCKGLYVLLQSLWKNAGWYPLWICPSIPLCGLFSMPLIISETYLCLSHLHLLPCIATTGCRLPGEEVIFSVIFSALFHAVAFRWLGFQLPTHGGKTIHQQAKAAFFKLTVSGHVLAASSKCLCLLVYLWDFKEMGFRHDVLSKKLRYQSSFVAFNFLGNLKCFQGGAVCKCSDFRCYVFVLASVCIMLFRFLH